MSISRKGGGHTAIENAVDIKSSPIPRRWREAAVFGAFWGIGEITIGTFLHATRIPLAGLIMSIAATALLVASSMVVGRSWFPLRTALVCAALRSLSPEGLMLGPMFAIAFQGFTVSLMLLLVRNPLVAGVVAGAINGMASQLQGFVVKLAAYGVNLWELYLRLVETAETLFHLDHGYSIFAIVAYLVVAGFLGACGGVLGWKIGNRATALKDGDHDG